MGDLFLDSTLNYSDPAKTEKQYLREDNTWTSNTWSDQEVMTTRNFYNSLGKWSKLSKTILPSSWQFQAMPWSEVAKLSDKCAGEDSEPYSPMLGYTKNILVDGLGIVKAKLIGLNHDEFSDGSPAGFTFQLTDGISWGSPVQFKMNENDDNIGGWASSDMRNKFLSEDSLLWKALQVEEDNPTKYIKEVKKKSSTHNSGIEVSETNDKLWLLSLIESIGSEKTEDYPNNPIEDTNYLYYEGKQYEYYAKNGKSAHIIKDVFGYAEVSWTRSIDLDSLVYFYEIFATGDIDIGDAITPHLPAAGFCISSK